MGTIEIPSDEYIKSKLKTKKAQKRSPRRRFKVLTDKLAREHVRLANKKMDDLILEAKERKNAWKSLT